MSESIFDNISSELRIAATQSPLVIKLSNTDRKWAYSICGTPIQRNVGVIMGINWGGGSDASGEKYAPQERMPTKQEFLKYYKNGSYNFLKLTSGYIFKYLNVDVFQGDFNYTNLCFFRSPSVKDISSKDYSISIPIFEKLIRAIDPPWILSLSVSNYDHLKSKFNEIITVKGIEGGKLQGYRGKLWQIPFYCVPHPGAHISGNERDAIWQNVFSGI